MSCASFLVHGGASWSGNGNRTSRPFVFFHVLLISFLMTLHSRVVFVLAALLSTLTHRCPSRLHPAFVPIDGDPPPPPSARTSASSVASFATACSADSPTGSDLLDDQISNSPLHVAAAKGDLTSLRTLLDEYDVDHLDSAGRTPLMYAVLGNKAKACRALLRAKASLNTRDDHGNTALIWAGA